MESMETGVALNAWEAGISANGLVDLCTWTSGSCETEDYA